MKYKVVISYPSDVKPERTVAHGVCADISRAKRADGVELVPFDWEDGVNHLITGDSTQKLIDGEIADADILICILWQRFGESQESLQGMTPTQWEVECALTRQQRTGRPIIKVFFKNAPYCHSTSEAATQRAAVLKFKEQLGARKIGLFNEFCDAEDFRKRLFCDLCDIVDRFPELTYQGVATKAAYQAVENYIQRSVLPAAKVFDEEPLSVWLDRDNARDLAAVVSREKRIALLGDAGTGKSTELQRVAAWFSEPDRHLCPLLLSLSTYMGDKSLQALLPDDFIALPDECMLLILDGFDEVQDKHRADAVRLLEAFAGSHPAAHILVSCRTNFYTSPQGEMSGTLKDFETFALLDLDRKQSKTYINAQLGKKSDAFWSCVSDMGLYDLVGIPLHLATLTQMYSQRGTLPRDRGDMFDQLLSWRTSFDAEKFRTVTDMREQQAHATRLIERVAVSMEMLGRNYITDAEFATFVPAGKDRALFRHLGVWQQRKSEDRCIWQFEHNNFQEYLAARVLARFPLEKVKPCVSFGPEFSRIIPSWTNTVCFLLDLYPDSTLLEWILSQEPEIVIHAEPSRVPFETRLSIFRTIIEDYKAKKTWIDCDRFDSGMLARFVDDRDRPDAALYLIDELEKAGDHIHIGNVVRVLQHLKSIPLSQRKRVEDLLLGIVLSDSMDDVSQHSALCALAHLDMNSGLTARRVVKHLRHAESDWVRYGLYYFLHNSDCLDEYVSVFLEGIVAVHASHRGGQESRLMNEGTELNRGLEKVSTFDGVCAIVDHFIQNPGDITSVWLKLVNEDLAEKAARLFPEHPAIYVKMLGLFAELANHCHQKEASAIASFFVTTGTAEKAFAYFLDGGQDKRECSHALAYLAERASLKHLVAVYKAADIPANLVSSVRNLLRWQDSELADWFHKYLNQETDNAFELSSSRDCGVDEDQDVARSLRLVFNKKAFIAEIGKVFDLVGCDTLSSEDLMDLCYGRRNAPQTASVVVKTLRNSTCDDPVSRKDALNRANKWDWGLFRASKVYGLLTENRDADLDVDQRRVISEWCRAHLEHADFRNAITVTGTRTSVKWMAIYLWYFYRKLGLDYPKAILLDMISFEYWGHEEFSGIDYLMDALPEAEMSARILSNLKEGIADARVLKNHLQYCQRLKVTDAIPYAVHLLEDTAQDDDPRRTSLELLAALPNADTTLEAVLRKVTDAFAWQVVEALWDHESEVCREFLRDRLSSGNEEDREFAAGYLIEIGESDGLEFYLSRTRETKRLLERPWQARERNPLVRVTGDEGLPLLILLLEESYSDDRVNTMFNTLYNLVLDALSAFALQSDDHYRSTVSALETFISTHQNLENVNFLHSYIERLARQFYVNKSVHLSIEEVVLKVTDLPFV